MKREKPNPWITTPQIKDKTISWNEKETTPPIKISPIATFSKPDTISAGTISISLFFRIVIAKQENIKAVIKAIKIP